MVNGQRFEQCGQMIVTCAYSLFFFGSEAARRVVKAKCELTNECTSEHLWSCLLVHVCGVV